MTVLPSLAVRSAFATLLMAFGLLALPMAALAQDDGAAPPVEDSTAVATTSADKFANSIAGEFTPAKGYDIIKTSRGSLNISVYGLFRYLNQLPGEQSYADHLGRPRTVRARNDLNWHRSMVWFSGFFYNPRFRYTMTVWALGSTQQTLVFGQLYYSVSKALTFGAGMAPNLTNRSMQGSWPFWAATDRQMSEEFMRGGFSSGFFALGEPISRLKYTVSLNTNLSQLGVTASNDSRDLAYSGSLSWLPTTGEFGPRGGLADFEEHRTVATRFGGSVSHAREDRAAPLGSPPNETQLRISDGLYLFEDGALANGVTVQKADYDEFAFDAALKYKGFGLQSEFYNRRLSNFLATGPLPDAAITDRGYMLELSHMIVPKKLNLYVAGGKVFDQFDRNPSELAGGLSYFPFGTRSWRLNLHVITIDKSPTASNFGYYTAGQSGTTVSLATDILL